MPRKTCLVLVTLMLGSVATVQAAPARDSGHRDIREFRGRIPSFSRQTGLACSVCHTSFPQLTSFGRLFKANGYTLANMNTITAPPQKGKPGLEIPGVPLVSALVQTSYSRTAKAQPDTHNGTTQFPQELGIFVGGVITKKIGSFLQMTYSGADGTFGLDNADIRFATQANLLGRQSTLGLTLNNNPTVQDLWNTTPAWGYPFASSEAAPTPAAATLVDGTLGQQVAGLGAYAFWASKVYGEFTVYGNAPQGAEVPAGGESSNLAKGVAPYWRLAIQHDWAGQTLEVGTFGMHARLIPEGVVGPSDGYTDVAFDAQYGRTIGAGYLTGRATWIHENQDLFASSVAGDAANQHNRLDSYRVNGTYSWQRGFNLTLGYFGTSGTSDAGLYAPESLSGSANGSPNSSGVIGQFDIMPWLNTRFAIQYTLYGKFNGASSNYDGEGRSASDNNTLYLLAWLMW